MCERIKPTAIQVHLRATGISGWRVSRVGSGKAVELGTPKAPEEPASALEAARQAGLKALGVEGFMIKTGLIEQERK